MPITVPDNTNDEKGVVIDVKNGKASVLLKKGGSCSGCGSCSAANDGKNIITRVPASYGVSAGDIVELGTDPVSQIKDGFFLYILPLILLFAGYAGGSSIFEHTGVKSFHLLGILTAAACFAMPYLFIYIKRRREEKRGKYKIYIKKIIHC